MGIIKTKIVLQYFPEKMKNKTALLSTCASGRGEKFNGIPMSRSINFKEKPVNMFLTRKIHGTSFKTHAENIQN